MKPKPNVKRKVKVIKIEHDSKLVDTFNWKGKLVTPNKKKQ